MPPALLSRSPPYASMTPPPDHPAGGFTLLELGIALLLSMLVGASLFAAYRLAARGFAEAERRAMLADALHVVMRRLAADLLAAERLDAPADGTWRLERPGGSHVTYTLREGWLARNGHAMLPAGVEVVAMRLEPASPQSRRVDVRLALGADRRADSAWTCVVLRAPPPWPPLHP